MPPANNLQGLKVGRLTVLRRAEGIRRKYAMWECVCKCGKTKILPSSSLSATKNKRVTRSCGCLAIEAGKRLAEINKLNPSILTHGECRGRKTSREYNVWAGMKDRCNNPKNQRYELYGGRGIFVCKSWEKFENFLSDMGRCPKDFSLDRINNDGNYEPSNCRWASTSMQMKNRSKSFNRIDIHVVCYSCQVEMECIEVVCETISMDYGNASKSSKIYECQSCKGRSRIIIAPRGISV